MALRRQALLAPRTPIRPGLKRGSVAFLERTEATILSPMRYPGSKRRLANYIAHTLELSDIEPRLFVEPFAGGASVALQLLNDRAAREPSERAGRLPDPSRFGLDHGDHRGADRSLGR